MASNLPRLGPQVLHFARRGNFKWMNTATQGFRFKSQLQSSEFVFIYKVSNVINAMAQSAEIQQKDLAPKLRRAIVKWVANSYRFKSGRPRIRKNGSAKFPCARAKNGLVERHHLENKASDFILQTSSLVGWMHGWKGLTLLDPDAACAT